MSIKPAVAGEIPTNGIRLQSEMGLAGSSPRRRRGGSRLMRTLRLLDFLQSGRVYTAQELAELCGVSKRTVFRDISSLQEAGLHILLDDSRGGYYVPHRLALPPSDLTFSEAAALMISCQGPGGQDAGIPCLDDARPAAAKVCESLPPTLRNALGLIGESISIRIEGSDAASLSRLNFQLSLRALLERQQLRIDYDDGPVDGVVTTVVDSYRLLFSGGGWHLVGRSSHHREVRAFSVRRMQNPRLLDDKYLIPLRFSLERFLGNAWRMVRGAQAYEVAILFDAEVADDIEQTRWHKTQQVRRLNDGRLEFRATVDGLDEIAGWILGFGPCAKVVGPGELRDRICDSIESMHRKYAGDPQNR